MKKTTTLDYLSKVSSRTHTKDKTFDVDMKYISNLSLADLNTYYQSADFTLTFTGSASGYKVYTKEKATTCEVIDKLSDTAYNSFDDFLADYTTFATTDKYLATNRYNQLNTVLSLEPSNNLFQYDLINESTTNVGSWSQGVSLVCEDKTFTTTLLLDTNVLGYENLAFGYDGTNIYTLNYKVQDTTKERYYLNAEAAKQLVDIFDYNTTIMIEKTINNGWTYVSLPSTMTLCIEEYKNDVNLRDICNQNHSIESVFNIDVTILKNSTYWSYWDKQERSYNLDKLSAISSKDGLLVKSNIKQIINLPYDIFAPLSNKYFQTYKSGWYLINNNFTNALEDVASEISKQNRTLKYILKQESDSVWGVYAPTNDDEVDASIRRLSDIKQSEAYWINVE
jgi:hypothetical protein